MSKNEFIKTVLSPLLRECFGEILGALYEKEVGRDVVYVNFRDSHLERYDITAKTKKEIVMELFEALSFGI